MAEQLNYEPKPAPKAATQRPQHPAVALLWAAIPILLGMYALRHAQTTVQIVWDTGLILFGAVMLLLCLFLWAAMKVAGGVTFEQRAANMIAQQKAVWGGPHERRDATPRDFRGFDVPFYDSTRAQLEKLGFIFIADAIDVTIAKALPGFSAIARAMALPDGSIKVSFWQIKPRGLHRLFTKSATRARRSIEFSTILSGDLFVSTLNANHGDLMEDWPFHRRRLCAPETRAEDLLKQHREHVSRIMAEEPSRTVVPMRTRQDMDVLSDRFLVLCAEHKANTSYITSDQIQRITDHPLTPEQRAVAEKVDELQNLK